jgi:hypothetical protein
LSTDDARGYSSDDTAIVRGVVRAGPITDRRIDR